ncbi:MAG: chorismate mutase [Bacilli bacterium]|nr:chorismate mutase [Bacilli bacterium]
MEDLTKIRLEIDAIDEEIAKLYERRMDAVKEVARYKIKANLPIYDEAREKAMLTKNLGRLEKDSYRKYYERVLNGFLSASKQMQNDLLKEGK